MKRIIEDYLEDILKECNYLLNRSKNLTYEVFIENEDLIFEGDHTKNFRKNDYPSLTVEKGGESPGPTFISLRASGLRDW